MALLVPYEGTRQVFEIVLAQRSLPEALILKLFTHPRTPRTSGRAADYTEPDFFGYAAIRLEPAGWRLTADDAPTVATHAEHAFRSAFTQPRQMVYGYYLVGETSNALYAAERFADGPHEMTRAGDRITVTPRFTARTDEGDD